MTFGEIFVAGKALIWFGIPIALALWELRRLARDKREREARRAVEADAEARSGEDGASPEAREAGRRDAA
jgi:hypothetical protein